MQNGGEPGQRSAVKLTYVSDDVPGIRRQPRGAGFSYVGPNGRAIPLP